MSRGREKEKKGKENLHTVQNWDREREREIERGRKRRQFGRVEIIDPQKRGEQIIYLNKHQK